MQKKQEKVKTHLGLKQKSFFISFNYFLAFSPKKFRFQGLLDLNEKYINIIK